MNKKIFCSMLTTSLLTTLAGATLILCVVFVVFSKSLHAAGISFYSFVQTIIFPLTASLIVATILSAFLSCNAAKKIMKPIKAVDLDHPNTHDMYEELSPLLARISTQNRTIARRIKEAERRQEEFRLITENMSEGFLTIDEVGNILTYNSAALRLLKIDNPNGGNVLSFNRTHEFRELVYTALAGNRAEKEMAQNTETYNFIANPVFDENKIIGAIIIILDVTESLKREQLRREFTSNVSHELKTPLTSISGFAEIMKSGATDSETVVDFSQSIYDEAQRLIALVSDIIKLTELDEGSIEFAMSDVDIFELSKEILARLAQSADKASVTLCLTGESAVISGAKKILDEMIYNLCDNAIKYNIPNGTVSIDIKNLGSHIVLTVCDSGIGIPQAEQTRVFERFYRVDKSHSKNVGGTGLGLSIVKHGAIYHNAQLSLESVVGKGTTITVTFNKQQTAHSVS